MICLQENWRKIGGLHLHRRVFYPHSVPPPIRRQIQILILVFGPILTPMRPRQDIATDGQRLRNLEMLTQIISSTNSELNEPARPTAARPVTRGTGRPAPGARGADSDGVKRRESGRFSSDEGLDHGGP